MLNVTDIFPVFH